MKLDAWVFSARLAWSHHWIKLASVIALVSSIAGGGWYFANVFPLAKEGGTFAYHYTVYFGIDDLRAWNWVFVLPVAWVGLTIADVLIAFGAYRKEPILASSLLMLAVLWAIPWLATVFYLVVINSSL